MENKTIKAYKGFNKDLTCRGFQYEVGKEYEHDGEVNACKSGFHACEAPLDCFGYYALGESVFHEVELSGETSRDFDDTKVAARHIKIGARLDIAGICKAQFDFVKSRCTKEPSTAGYKGTIHGGLQRRSHVSRKIFFWRKWNICSPGKWH